MATIEQKAIAYDKAIEKIKYAMDHGVQPVLNKEDLLDIFTELKEKENEGERIRKVLIGWINLESSISFGDTFDGFSKEQILAWLEKQEDKDSQVKLPTFTFDDILALQCCMETVKKVQEDKDLYEKLNDIHGRVYDAYYLEKQGEQKPADKVEPKFKVGDWCIDNEDGTIFQIVKVLDNTYKYRTNEGKEYSCTHYSLELDARVWTIQDAKDGDILHSTGFHNDCIFIFNGLDNWKFDEPNGDRAVATGYCCLSVSADNMEFGIQGPDCVEVNTVKPATKTQRDLLFRKIKEAGYEWDAEKKELKEIENEEYDGEDYGIDSLWHAKNILEKTLGKVDGYQTDDGILDHKCAITAVDKLYKHSIAWSEKDKHWMQKVIDFMNHPDLIKATPTLAKDTINWLKSLKDRYAWKTAMNS